MTELEAWVWDIGTRGIRPDPNLVVSDWADQFRILSSVSSAEAGPWRTSRVPYLKAIMDALSSSSPYERVIFMSGSQVGKTEGGLNWIGYIIDLAPSSMLYVVPTKEMAQEVSKTRLDPLIEGSPALRDKVSDPRSRDSGNTIYLKEFPGGYVNLVGANSPAALSAKPIRYVYLDEVDRFPGNVGGEGDPVNLAIARTRTYARRKIYMTSTPTIAGHSRIDAAFDETDKRYFYVPCPRCGEMQVLKFPNLKWEKGRPEGAWYECPHCGGRIYNHEKEAMLPRGEWRATATAKNGLAVGFHLSSLYSPVGWFSWGEIATMFEESRKSPDLLRVFVNTVLGETYTERGEAPDWKDIYGRREGYEVGKVPGKGLILTAGADVQKDRIEVSVWAWGRDKESWLVEHRVFPGDTSDIHSPAYQNLDELMGEAFEHEYGAALQIRCLAIDTGYNTQVVYNWARRYPVGRVMPIKGSDSMPVMVGQPKAVDVNINGKKKARALKLYSIGVSIIKMEFYGWLWLPKPEGDDPTPAGYVHFPDLPEEYFQQITAEDMKVKTGPTKKTVFEWVKLRERNEALDCRVYARAAAALLNIDRFTYAHWTQIEEAVIPAGSIATSTADVVAAVTKPAPPMTIPRTKPRNGRRVMSRGVRL